MSFNIDEDGISDDVFIEREIIHISSDDEDEEEEATVVADGFPHPAVFDDNFRT
jgi:hypothetical protein